MEKKRHNVWYKVIMAVVILIAVMAFSCCLGSVRIPVRDVIGAVTGLTEVSKATDTIVNKVRFPRICMAVLVGGGLSMVGALMQGLFKNPMADPSILGISSGSAFGAALIIVFNINFSFMGFSGLYLGAMGGAVLAWFLVYNIARISGEHDLNSTLLAGIAISSILSALITLLMTLHRESMEQVYLWMLGSFSSSTAQKTVTMAVVVAVIFPVLIFTAPRVDVLKLGREAATGLGVSASRTTGILLCACSVLLAFCVANSGIIGFVGLIIPHCVNFMRVYKMRGKLVMCFLVGAVFTLLCDTLARTVVAPGELAIGALTSLIGAPYFLYLMLRNLLRERRMR
ncbi:MAG: iron ABC transporter permease [Clostridiales bacterium]|nr:iron ABC transporter permease [Clostridiales bacterium]